MYLNMWFSMKPNFLSHIVLSPTVPAHVQPSTHILPPMLLQSSHSLPRPSTFNRPASVDVSNVGTPLCAACPENTQHQQDSAAPLSSQSDSVPAVSSTPQPTRTHPMTHTISKSSLQANSIH